MAKHWITITGVLLLVVGLIDAGPARGRPGGGAVRGAGAFHSNGGRHGLPGARPARASVGNSWVQRGSTFGHRPWRREIWTGATGSGADYGYEPGYGYYNCELGSRLIWNGVEWVTIC